MRLQKRLDGAIILAMGVGAVLFWYFRLIAPATDMHAGSGDLYTQIYPMAQRASQWMRHGDIPLWNPFQFCGHPFLASVLYGIFYPLNFPYLLLSTAAALEAIAVLHIFLAGLFTYLYARVIDVSRVGAAGAGLVFMLSGFVAGEALWFTPAIGAIAWLPVGFIAIEKLLEQPRLRWSLLLAAAVAMPILAGWLQTWTYSMYAVFSYAGLRLLAMLAQPTERRRAVRAFGCVALGLTLGLSLAAVQLLPSGELQRLGPRRPGGLTLIQALIVTPISPQNLLAQALDSAPGFPRGIYVGMLPLLLLPIALVSRVGRLRIICLACLAVASICIALTVYTPLFALFRALPGGSWFRVPWRIMFIYVFVAAVLSGVAIDVIARRAEGESRSAVVLAVAVATALALAAVSTVDMPARSSVLLAAGLLLIWGAALFRWPLVRNACVAGMLGLLVWDLFLASRSPALHPFHDLTVYDQEGEAFNYIKAHQDLGRTYIHWSWPGNPPVMPKQGTLREIFSITDYEPLSLDRFVQFYRLLEARLQPDSDPRMPPAAIGYLELGTSPQQLRLLDLLSVKYIVSAPLDVAFAKALNEAMPSWRIAYSPRVGNYAVFENPHVLPRAYIAAEAWPVAAGEDALTALTAPGFDDRQVVVLESTEAQPLPKSDGRDREIVPARIARYAPTRVQIDANSTAPGYLVLTDTYYPGWQATVDGRPVPIYRANYLFRAVSLPAGRHSVLFTYDPLSFKLGAGVTLIALFGVAVGVLTSGWHLARCRRPAHLALPN